MTDTTLAFPGHERWHALLNSAILGVERQPPTPLLAEHPLKTWVSSWSALPHEQQVLREAFVVDRSLQAGHRCQPLSLSESAVLPAMPERTPVQQALLEVWRQAQKDHDSEACEAWLPVAVQQGVVLPSEDIPAAWAWGERSVAVRDALAAVAGPMGTWLIQQPKNPWPYMAAHVVPTDPESVVKNEDRPFAERAAALRRWAMLDASSTFAWVQEVWSAEKSDMRETMLDALRNTGAVRADESWWRDRLNDRSTKVRALAREVLWCEPSSRFAQGEHVLTQACFEVATGRKGASTLTIVLPAPIDTDASRWVHEQYLRDMGPQAQHLMMRVGHTPPSLFESWDGLTWEQRLALACKNDEWPALSKGWLHACVTYGDRDLASALCPYIATTFKNDALKGFAPMLSVENRRTTLLGMLGLPTRTSYLQITPAMNALMSAEGVWDSTFTQTCLQTRRYSDARDDLVQRLVALNVGDWSTLNDVVEGWSDDHRFKASTLHLLNRRATLLKALKATG